MPDGDILRNGFRRLYQNPYKWLCDGKANDEECSQAALRALKQDLIKRGDLPIHLAQNMADIFIQAINTCDKSSSIDYGELRMNLDGLVQKSDGPHNLKELILRAGKRWLHDLRYGEAVDIKNISADIISRYINEVYESEFKARVLTAVQTDNKIDGRTVVQRLNNMDENISSAIEQWSKKAALDNKITKIRLPRQKNLVKVDLNENLMAA